ncbi:MAG: ribosomal protein S18-alanine N-acetyltransferase [Lachnospiraceae bacterium]|nr:ribosomal protein S18-alanine N-acetyltransferase [Lachnospiraceae bacterium]
MIELSVLQYEDCEEVANIAKQSLPEAWSADGFRDTLKYSDNIYYVARDTEKDCIVGFAGIMIIVDEAELLNIAVLEKYRKRGIAQQLLDTLLIRAKQEKGGRMLLEVRESNRVAIALYEKNGFCFVTKRRDYYSNPKEDAVIMEKSL